MNKLKTIKYNMFSSRLFLIPLISFLIFSCSKEKKLKYYGRHDVVAEGDTNYYTIPNFEFLNQDSIPVNQKELSQYIYVADFFFTTCPSICPIMAQKLLKVHEQWKDDPRFKIVSHTLDPKYDTPSKLKEYASNLNIKTDQWMFLWGSKEKIYEIAENYYIPAVEDENVQGGINHSGKLVLIDRKGRVRGFYEGTKDYGIIELMKDIPLLLKEYEE